MHWNGKSRIAFWAVFLIILIMMSFAVSGCRADTEEEAGLTDIVEIEKEREFFDEESASGQEAGADIAAEAQISTKDSSIYVDVCGQVKNPGVYELPQDSRVYEAVEKAGGITSEAAPGGINQAEQLSDGQQIYVPSKKEIEQGASYDNGQREADTSGKVNLNIASKEELMTLGGIGEVKAEAIVRHREEHGRFQSIEDIKKIEGIKEGVFNKIKDQITV